MNALVETHGRASEKMVKTRASEKMIKTTVRLKK